MRRIVLSPHLDDAVLSCFAVLRGATVLTVFTDGPQDDSRTDWDTRCGAGTSRELMALRREEDRRALAAAGARPRHLGYRERAYGDTDQSRIVTTLAAELTSAEEIWLPAAVGGHGDHAAVRAAGFAALGPAPSATIWLYADYPYHRYLDRADSLAGLRAWSAGRLPAEVPLRTTTVPDVAAKRAAARCYASQLPAIEATVDGTLLDDDHLGTEYAWRLR
jgi:LmbE family N-acetylglucosaminyl deacetylase